MEEKNTLILKFIPNANTKPSGMSLIKPAWVKLNRLQTGAVRFWSIMHKWSFAPSATCECGADDQTANYIYLHCVIHCAPAGIRGVISLDQDTTSWLLNSCPDI